MTFADFPGRLQHVLSETIENVAVECIVFPAYETKGELVSAGNVSSRSRYRNATG